MTDDDSSRTEAGVAPTKTFVFIEREHLPKKVSEML
jgi:hypothetical protein